ncbi:MAG: phosphoribosylamine--glycine ligase [Solobacterium sp.]|nr:phosphoribosylamine--glycine ligase [Solobacterium sp.]
MAKVLVIGSGGREHAIAWAFSKSERVEKVYVAPGNPGMEDVAECVNIKANDFESLSSFVKENNVDLTFVGPEDPLVNGIVDYFEDRGLKVFGPRANAALLEGSKAFTKEIMKKYDIPTAKYETFTDFEAARAYLEKQEMPIVLKADGLAAGKGVIIAQNLDEAVNSAREMMLEGKFNNAGNTLVIEEFLEGEEFSLLALVKDENVYPLQIAQDHKRAYDNDEGLNTGGMGAYTPVNHLPQSAIDEAMEKVMKPMAKAMVKEGRNYQGILYGGMMLTKNGVKTIEFNCRFGDPETEVILQALQGDFYEICTDVLDNKTPEYSFDDNVYLGVVMASTNYPESSTKGVLIENINAKAPEIFHMGTAKKDGKYYTNGGRVLFVSGKGKDIKEAYDNAYKRVSEIKSEALFYRHDIGFKAMKGE